ncbi:MAG: DUF4982 domain-containing protein, partial [Muribaculaceae bacterium]|nr:DUF4982 domain-containing protein [Muribaculaceae bacterium]
ITGLKARKVSLNDGWQFRKVEEADWRAINLPHTWNTDAYTEKNYHKGKALYRRTLRLNPEDSLRNFHLRFEGVSKAARVMVNGKEAGHHKGGYTAFSIPISEYLSFTTPNLIEVEVDNDCDDIPPRSGDFTFFGGIYRDVWLEDYSPLHFSLNPYATPGIKVTPYLENGLGVIDVEASVTNDVGKREEAILRLDLYSPDEEFMASEEKKVKVDNGAVRKMKHSFGYILNPQLWSPDSPQLYKIEATLLDFKGNILDKRTVDTGLRHFYFDSQGRFILNGTPLKLRGVNRHQDMKPYGPALRDEAHRRDMLLAKDMGANFIRIAHYPQDPAVLEYADRLGLLVWEEIPLIDAVPNDSAYANTAETNLREMITQHYNHPSVIMWGYMNEILLNVHRENPGDSAFSSALDRTHRLISRLENVAKKTDPTRFTTMAFHGSDEYRKVGIAAVPDLNGWNLYQGWYGGDLTGFEKFLSTEHRNNPSKPIIVSEYGAGSDRRLHSLSPQPFDFSIEYQQKYLEHYMRVIEDSAFVAGGAHWNLIDFGSAIRDESMPRINNKGLLYTDRTPKDVYHFFKASWRDDIDHVYIASRDWSVRTVVSDSAVVTMPVKIYANTPNVELMVNGKSAGKVNVENHTALFNVPLQAGINNIIARGGNSLDAFNLKLDIVPATLTPAHIDPFELAVNVGSNCSFVSPVTGLTWVDDREYQPGGWGHIGGKRRSITSEIKGTEEGPLFQTMLEEIEEYRFDVPDGEYEIELGFADPSGPATSLAYMLNRDTEADNELTRFTVEINGNPVASDFTPSAINGSKFATITKYILPSVNNSISIKFISLSGTPFLNTIKLRRL